MIDGAEKASHVFAGDHINAGGRDFDGVPGKGAGASGKAAPRKADEIGTDTQKAVPTGKPASAKAVPPAKAEPKTSAAQTSLDLDEAAGSEPELLTGARDGKADDLKRIKGVGPKIEGILNEIGVFHFDQIAAWTEENKAWVETRLKFKGRIDREDWIAQAKVLASGGDTEFSQRVDSGDVPTSKA